MKAIWTAKAESDWARKHPGHRKNPRKAGTVATYEGKEIAVSMADNAIYRAWKERGWVQTEYGADEPPQKPEKNNALSIEQKVERWKNMQEWLGSENGCSLKEMTAMLGLGCTDTLRYFVQMYGRELSAKCGLLPYNKALSKGCMGDFMEEAPAELPKIDKRIQKQNERWKVLIKDIKAKKSPEQIAVDFGVRDCSSVREFVNKNGERLVKEIGALPYSLTMPKYMKKFMEA